MSHKEEAIKRIAQDFVTKMAKAGLEFESATTEGTPTISFYAHAGHCPSRKGRACDCRPADPGGER